MGNDYSISYYYYLKGRKVISDLNDTLFSSNKTKERNAYFKASLTEYFNLDSYIRLLYKTAELNPVYTNVDIEPDTLGCDNKDVLLKYGKPDFIFNNNKLKIFVYGRMLNKLKIRYEIHFYDNKVFLLSQTYRHINSEDKNYLITSTIAKYSVRDVNILNCKITDNNNNVALISDYLHGLRISYLSNRESGWFAGMTREIDAKINPDTKYDYHA